MERPSLVVLLKILRCAQDDNDIMTPFSKNSFGFLDGLLITALSIIVVFFLAVNLDAHIFFKNYTACLGTFILTFAIILLLRTCFDRLALLPIVILLLLIPYSFFYTQLDNQSSLYCLLIALGGIFMFNVILKDQPALLREPLSWRWLFIVVGIYVTYFAYLSILRHLNYQDTSSFDVAIYSQIQWNTVHGRFLQDSISGSNFVTHNSLFLLLLAPLYALFPHPANLLFLKTLFIGAGAIPFYLILRNYVTDRAALPLVLAYLFYPFILGQNINAPHETCFLMPFVLFSFYFFIKRKFRPFFIFLFIALTVKEHMALLCVAYGLYAWYRRREPCWVIVPIFLGITWALLSMWVIHHFQQIYTSDPSPAWLIKDIKDRFLPNNAMDVSSFVNGIQTSNFARTSQILLVYLLLAPLAIVFPFWSMVSVLGLPELLINLVASYSLIYPTWHYNIVTSCFFLVGSVETIQKLSNHKIAEKLKLPSARIQELCAWFLCVCVLGHFFLWSEYCYVKKDPIYVATMNEAIALVPRSASVSVNKYIAGHVTDRKDYYLLANPIKGDYVVLDKTDQYDDLGGYTQIFNKDGIRVYKK